MTNGLSVSIEDLKNLVGQLTIDNMALRQENQLLKEMLVTLREKVAILKESQPEGVNSIVDEP